jgi:hypothetical protein
MDERDSRELSLYSSLNTPAFRIQAAKPIEMGLKARISGASWSQEEDERLRQLAISGLSSAAVAAKMKRSKSSVRFRALKLEIAIARDRNAMQRPTKSEKANAAEAGYIRPAPLVRHESDTGKVQTGCARRVIPCEMTSSSCVDTR